jgi:hypothetical protein
MLLASSSDCPLQQAHSGNLLAAGLACCSAVQFIQMLLGPGTMQLWQLTACMQCRQRRAHCCILQRPLLQQQPCS